MIRDEGFDLLIEKHAKLNDEVDKLSRLNMPIQYEQQKMKELKILKLRYRDAIESFRNSEKLSQDRKEID